MFCANRYAYNMTIQKINEQYNKWKKWKLADVKFLTFWDWEEDIRKYTYKSHILEIYG